MATRVNYLNNKDMLSEIHKSKISFCEFSNPDDANYDIILDCKEDIFKEGIIQTTKENRAARIADSQHRLAVAKSIAEKTTPKPKLSEFKIDPETFTEEDLVFRVMTYEHIPLEGGRKKNPKNEADTKIKLMFVPFVHYKIKDGELVRVLVSHSKDGKFCQSHGSITNKLAKMFLLMVNRYSQRSNWRGYTYLDEMKGQSLLQLSQMGLQFNEAKSDNPFSYFTASVSNAFTRVLNIEKKNQNIRDDLLVEAGQNPSYSRQIAIEDEIRRIREDAASDTE